MQNIEIEIQVQIEHRQPLESFLKEKATWRSKNQQIDEYFSPEQDDFLVRRPVGRWLRLRNADGNYSINYKNFHYQDGKTLYCDEFESPVEKIDQLQHIFSALHLKSICIVNKQREIFEYKEYEIALDRVANLGDFVEIEYKGEADKGDAAQIKQEMITFLKDLGVGKICKNSSGYPYQLLFKDEIAVEEY